MKYTRKVAVVTGAKGEIGRAVALRLAAEGVAIDVTGGTPAKVEAFGSYVRDRNAPLRCCG
jgi:NAD(P)-dependent dehydrogenase (short-subunit alcohol dehydrogenase family)